MKAVAGSISHTVRGSQAPTLQAVGASSVNQAIKSIAVARSFLSSETYDLMVEASRVPNESIRNLVQLKLTKMPKIDIDNGKVSDLRAAAQTDTSGLAGAIANVIREGKTVRVTAVGAASVFRAVDSIIKARTYVQKRDSFDLFFVPQFVTLPGSNNQAGGEDNKDGGEGSEVINAIQCIVMRKP